MDNNQAQSREEFIETQRRLLFQQLKDFLEQVQVALKQMKYYKNERWFNHTYNQYAVFLSDFFHHFYAQFKEITGYMPVEIDFDVVKPDYLKDVEELCHIITPSVFERLFGAIFSRSSFSDLLIRDVLTENGRIYDGLQASLNAINETAQIIEKAKDNPEVLTTDNDTSPQREGQPIEEPNEEATNGPELPASVIGTISLDTSFTLQTAIDWSIQRIIIDLVQNHLPADASGTITRVRFHTRDGAWHDISEIAKYEDSDIDKIEVSDDGKGYGYKRLVKIATGKLNKEGSAGKFGEGMKMASVALLKYKNDENNPHPEVGIQFRSRDWMAEPFTEEEVLDPLMPEESKVDAVRIRVMPKKQSSEFEHDEEEDIHSATTLINPTPEMIKQFRDLGRLVLAFGHNTPVTSIGVIDVLDYDGGRAFVRGLLIPGNHNLKYSYNFKTHNIKSRDRGVFEKGELEDLIRRVIEFTVDREFIKKFLRDAQESVRESNTDLVEFSIAYSLGCWDERADLWIECFKEVFGEHTAIRSAKSQDMNAVHNAQHMGLQMVTLPDALAQSLCSIRGTHDEAIESYEMLVSDAIRNSRVLEPEELTDKHIRRIALLKKYFKLLEVDTETLPLSKIYVFTYDKEYQGQKANGYYKPETPDAVYIQDTVLEGNVKRLGDVFFHEVAHQQSGGGDPDPTFRDYLTKVLSLLAHERFADSVDEDDMAEDVTIGDLRAILMAESAMEEESPLQDLLLILAQITRTDIPKESKLSIIKNIIEEMKWFYSRDSGDDKK